jgi:hypothetical protein
MVILIELNRPGYKRGKVERIVQVRKRSNRLCDDTLPDINDQMQDSEKNVGESNGRVRKRERNTARYEGVALQPEESEKHSGYKPYKERWRLTAAEYYCTSKAQ